MNGVVTSTAAMNTIASTVVTGAPGSRTGEAGSPAAARCLRNASWLAKMISQVTSAPNRARPISSGNAVSSANTDTAAASASRPDPRASAAPLLTDVLNRINERGSVRSTVRGDLGFVGDLDGAGVARYNPDGSDVSLRGHTRPNPQQRPQPLELAVLDGVGYLKSPLLRPDPAKPWLRIAPDGTDFAAKLLAPALRQLQDSTDPRATFRGIEHATKIQSSAPDQVDGQPATHYSLRVLTGPAAASAPDEQQRKRLQRAADSGQPEIGYELWIGPDGLPLRFAAAQKVAQAGQVSLDSTYRDWGT